jgi:hypothetical protein
MIPPHALVFFRDHWKVIEAEAVVMIVPTQTQTRLRLMIPKEPSGEAWFVMSEEICTVRCADRMG